MKILYFTIIQSPFIVELASELQKEIQCDSLILNVLRSLPPERSHWGKTIKDNVIIEQFPHNITDYLNKHNPDIIIYTGYRTKGINKAKKWAKNNNCKFFMYACEKLIEYKKNDFLIWLKYQIYKIQSHNINGVLACGNRAMQLYQKYTNSPVINIPYTFNMDNLKKFDLLKYDGSDLVFLISGRLESFRNPIYSIKIYSQIKKRLPNIKTKLIISGKGSLYNDIIKLIEDLDLTNDVKWINNFSKWEEIHEIYKKAHILLCLQDYGGWGVIVQEAMAAGLIVVGSSGVDAVDQLIIDGYNGIYANLKDPNNIIDSIIDIANNPQLFNHIRINARNSIECNDVKFYAKKLSRFLKNN